MEANIFSLKKEEDDALDRMTAKELKHFLQTRNVDHSQCVERTDLIALAKKTVAKRERGNELWKEKSPYLLQHKNNPVHWMAYGPAAFELAKKEDKPILISIGYATCHWCHVMEHESFEDHQVADLLNKEFVAIKVDREELPDVDAIYMRAAQAIGGGGGWPLNVFVTPDLHPFYAGTYFPKMQFMSVLNQISVKWTDTRDEITDIGTKVHDMLLNYDSFFGKLAEPLNTDIFSKAFQNSTKRFDAINGGFGKAPKFPPSMQLKTLMRIYRRTGEKKALEMVETTLNGMARGGMYDHLGGGFARYSTDPYWLVPHFEKMLYDNALLIQVYLEAFQITGKDMYRSVAEETLHYIMTVMHHPEGGYYSAEDADSEGVEGKFYIWSKKELETLLSKEEFEHFCKVYGVTDKGNFEHENILNLQKEFEWKEKENPLIKNSNKILFEVREKRIHPLKDDKILTCWNGLMIHSMAMAARILGESKYLKSAQEAVKFIQKNMVRDGHLLRRYRDGEAKFVGTLDDYAYLIEGLIELYQTDFNNDWLTWAIELQDIQNKLFWDDKDGGYFFTPKEGDVNLIVRTKEFIDDARPNSNAISALNLMQLYHLTYREEYRKLVDTLMMSVGQLIEKAPEAYGQTMVALDYRTDTAKQVAIISNDIEEARSLLKSVWKMFNPNAVYALGSPGSKLAIMEGKSLINDKTTAYICEGTVCKAPTNSFAEILEEIKSSQEYKLKPLTQQT